MKYINKKTQEIVELLRRNTKCKWKSMINVMWSDEIGIFYLSDFRLNKDFNSYTALQQSVINNK